MTAQSIPARSGLRSWTAAQRFALLFGAVYVVVGVAGFAVTGFSDFAGMHHDKLLVFSVNPAHNVIHLALGLAWLAAAAHHRAAKTVNLVIGVVLGLVTVLGLADGMGMLGMSGLADPDNFLHLATATLALYFGSLAAGTPAERAPAEAPVR
jgi:Domain of unknown function (DUF4383)